MIERERKNASRIDQSHLSSASHFAYAETTQYPSMKQQTALNILKSGANVFLTGEPGAGKTYLINQYARWLRAHGIWPAVTASTGIAATHIGGMTLHSWSGIGIRKTITERDLAEIMENGKTVSRIANTRVLIIDEISMLDARTLNAVDQVCRTIKEPDLPFGGLQVIFVGDFFQLPPISRQEEGKAEFAFQASSWKQADPITCYLSEQYRQEDEAFLSILSELRRGEISQELRNALKSRLGKEQKGDHTRLYSHNINVDRVNDQKLNEIAGEPRTYRMQTKGPKAQIERLQKSCLSPEFLLLKIGARIMFTKNGFEKGYVNGTIGEVIKYDDASGYPVVRTLKGKELIVTPAEWAATDGERVIAKVNQLPLRLAWAMTIHKSQGLSLDSAMMDLSEVFEYGQGYVALSRVRSMDGLHLLGLNERALQVHPEILEHDESFRAISDRAEQEFTEESEDMQKTQEEFIRACGGTIVAVPVAEIAEIVEKKPRIPTQIKTLSLIKEGKSLKEIAEERDVTQGTIIGHIEKLFMDDELTREEIIALMPKKILDALDEIASAFNASEDGRLTPIKEQFGDRFSFDDLRFARIVTME